MTDRIEFALRNRTAGVFVLLAMGIVAASAPAQTTQPSPGGAASGTFQGNSYELVLDTTTSWTNAQSTAQVMGGYLVTITSAAEDQFVDSLLTKGNATTGSYWIGLSRSGNGSTFSWVTKEPVSYTNWTPGVPDNFGGVENRGSILWTSAPAETTFTRRGQWNDLPDAGYPPGFGQPDLKRGGYVIEFDSAAGGATGGTGNGVPLPAAALLFVPGAGVAMLAARRFGRKV